MAVIVEIDGIGRVELDDGFRSLSSEKQNEVIQGIAASIAKPKPAQEQAQAQPRTGSVLDGMSAEEIAQAMASPSRLGAGSNAMDLLSGGPKIDTRQPTGKFMSAIGGIAQGGTMGFADEITAAVTAPFSPRSYDQIVTDVRANYANARESNPNTFFAGEVGGGVASAVGAMPAAITRIAAKVPQNLLGRSMAGVGLGATAGATQGAISGVGYADGQNIGDEALRGGAIGLLLGGGIGGVAPSLAAGTRLILERVKGYDITAIQKALGVSKSVATRIKTELAADNFDAAAAAIRRGGDDGMMADALPNLLDEAAQSSPAAGRIATNAVEGRVRAEGAKVAQTLDNILGVPSGIKGAKRGIASKSSKLREDLYNQAYAREIDWNSPAGMELRAVLGSTPTDVMGAAGKTRAMGAGLDGKLIPDSAYAGEFAPSVTQKAGPKSGNWQERQDVENFFKTYRELSKEKLRERPLTNMIMATGIDPRSAVAKELYANGVTPKAMPGLFKFGGLKGLDNLEPDQLPETLRFTLGPNDNYVDQQRIIDAIVEENKAVKLVRTEDADLSGARQQLAEMDTLFDEYTARRAKLKAEDRQAARGRKGPDLSQRGDTVPMKTIQDLDMLKRELDGIRYSKGEMNSRGGISEYAKAAGKRADKIRDLLVEISPVYRQALAEGRDTIRQQNAVDIGRDLLSTKTKGEDLWDWLDSLPKDKKLAEAEKRAAIQGLRQSIDDALAQVRAPLSRIDFNNPVAMQAAEQAVALVKIMSSRDNMDKVSALLGKGRTEALFRTLDTAANAAQLRLRTATGSATARRNFGQKMSQELVNGTGVVAAAREGKGLNAAQRAWQSLTGATSEAKMANLQEHYAEIAKALTQKRGPEAENALRIIERAMDGQPMKSAEAIRVGRALGIGVLLPAYQLGQQSLARP